LTPDGCSRCIVASQASLRAPGSLKRAIRLRSRPELHVKTKDRVSMKHLSLAVSLALSMLACGGSSPTTPTALVAPTQPTFTLSGVVSAVTPTGLTPLQGAQVFVSGHRTMTDEEGRYSISGLEPNAFGFAVTASKAGYASETTNLTKSVDATVDMQLVRTALYTLAGVVS